MTALAGYERLECEGRYRAAPDAPEQSVLVKFGDASLMIMSFAETPITHWPLASLGTADRPGAGTLRLQPDAGAPDRLEIDDPAMIAAITAVCRGVRRGRDRAHNRRSWRWPLRFAALAVLLAAGLAAAPAALDRLAESLPEPGRARLGAAALRSLAGTTLCETPAGRAALDALARQLSPADGPAVGLMVADLPQDRADAVGAPGRQVLLSHRLVAGASGPAALADAVARALAEARAARHTAFGLRHAGPGGLTGLLSGDIDSPALVAATVAGLARPRPEGPAIDAEAAALRAAMPLDRAAQPLSLADWRAIKSICTR